jgi:proton glutamate symport protein
MINLFKTSLALQMAIATVLGVFFGLFLGEMNAVFAPWASAYVMVLKITTIPYLVGALIHGIGQLSSTQAKQIMKKGALFIGLAWSINIAMIYLMTFLFPQAQKSSISGYFSREIASLNFAELLIPENIFYSLSNNIIPSVVIFSLLLGIALMHMKEKTSTMSMLQTGVDALMRVTSWISRIAPLGTFIIIANQVGTIQFEAMKQVSTYIILYIIITCLTALWIFPRLTGMLTNLSALRWLKELLPILLLAYTTNVVIVCLPFIINLIQRETAELDPRDEKAQNQIQGTVSIIFNLPLGSLFITVFVLFASVFYNTPLNFSHHIQLFVTTLLTGLGAVGLGSWINTLSFLIDSLGMSLSAINLYLTTLPFTSGFQAMTSAMEISTLSLFITLACRKRLSLNLSKIVKSCLITLVPILLLVIGIKVTNPLPIIQNPAKSIAELEIPTYVKTSIYTSAPAPRSNGKEDTLDRILRTKTLRVGYNPHTAPFCFYNKARQLVGYDMAFAFALAEALDCSIEFIPMNYGRLSEEIQNNLYDIGMSAITITDARLRSLVFAEPYLEAKIVFVLGSGNRKIYSSIEAINNNPDVRIIVFKGSSFESFARCYFPNKEIISITDYETFKTTYADDLLLWEEQEAISWVMRHRGFTLFIPNPSIGVDTLGYAIRPNSERFLNYLNQWLRLKKNEGFTKSQYDLWVLGQTESATKAEPRWSIIRDVLHWTH